MLAPVIGVVKVDKARLTQESLSEGTEKYLMTHSVVILYWGELVIPATSKEV